MPIITWKPTRVHYVKFSCSCVWQAKHWNIFAVFTLTRVCFGGFSGGGLHAIVFEETLTSEQGSSPTVTVNRSEVKVSSRFEPWRTTNWKQHCGPNQKSTRTETNTQAYKIRLNTEEAQTYSQVPRTRSTCMYLNHNQLFTAWRMNIEFNCCYITVNLRWVCYF